MSIQTTTLDATFAGELITPDHQDYDAARKLFNGAHDKRPALIARCTGPHDVQAALVHAQEHGLVVAVRGGGHSIPGYSSCDGGIVIDTGPMKSVEIDVEGRTGRFGAGLTWGELDAATQAHGLAVTGGRISHTGVAGLTLGSGSGWLERACGITCASLVSAEVVTADGRILRASAGENAELFWGLRGGGGNFGVVTELEFALQPVGPIVYAGMILHPRAAAPELLRFYRDFMEGAPDELCGGVSLMTAPPEEFVPEEARGKPAVGLLVLYAGDPGEGERAFRPLVEWGDPWLRAVQPMPYVAVQRMLDPAHPWGITDYSKSDYLPELTDDAIDTLVRKMAESSSPFTGFHLCQVGGAAARVDRDTMALEPPQAKWFFMCEAMAMDPVAAETEAAWARSLVQALRPWTTGRSLPNFISADDGQARLRASYGEAKFARLVALKDEFDPGNVFALNQNIPPTARSATG
jgi:FAD/FMN-containing dehydrogenase